MFFQYQIQPTITNREDDRDDLDVTRKSFCVQLFDLYFYLSVSASVYVQAREINL